MKCGVGLFIVILIVVFTFTPCLHGGWNLASLFKIKSLSQFLFASHSTPQNV
jgi:hypothetical protein